MLTAIGAAGAATGCFASDAAEPATSPVLVEMFLSQSCKASPPAADFITSLGARPDVVALSWHVGYWDRMTGRSGGVWRDPFSKPSFAARHRFYNRRIRGKEWVMTPQAVVNGDATASGAKTEKVLAMIARAHGDAAPRPGIDFRPDGNRLYVTVKDARGEVLLVRFADTAKTEIEGGDNDGVLFSEINVVTAVELLGALDGASGRYSFRAPGADAGCAVLVQEPNVGRVHAARYCP